MWEHTHDRRQTRKRFADDVGVIRRTIAGMPADVSWRRSILRAQRILECGPGRGRRFGERANRTLIRFGACGVGVVGASVLALVTEFL